MSSRAAIYTRISRDPCGTGLGVARQEAECRDLAARIDAQVVRVYVDDDSSAFCGVPRPAFEQLLDDVKAGLVDVVIAWHPDRLYRRQRDLLPFIDTVQATAVQVATVTAGNMDLSTASGRMVARVVGAAAEHESERKSERLQLKHGELARRGRWAGGATPYGFRYVGDGMLEIEPEQAAIIREAAERVLQGQTLHSICKNLSDRQIATARGGVWRVSTLANTLTMPSVFGFRVWRGELFPGVWQPILDRDTVERLTVVIRNPARKRTVPSGVALLTGGRLRCGRCGHPLVSAWAGPRPRVYVCKQPPDGRGCGSLSIVAEKVEATIKQQVLSVLASPAGAALILATGSDQEAAKNLVYAEALLRELSGRYAAGELTTMEWRTCRQVLSHDIACARSGLAKDRAFNALADLPTSSGQLEVEWGTWSLERRRQVVDAVIDHTTIRPSSKSTGGRFDPTRVTDGICWVQRDSGSLPHAR